MKKMYTKIIVLLVFLIGGLGCVKSSKNTESGLTTLNVNTDPIIEAINTRATKYSGLKPAWFNVLIVGYNQGENPQGKPEFQCYTTPQSNDLNSDDCILDEDEAKDSEDILKFTTGMPGSNTFKVLFGLESGKLSNTQAFINPYDPEDLIKEFKNKDLSSLSLKYNKNYDYYGFMAIGCITEKTKEQYNQTYQQGSKITSLDQFIDLYKKLVEFSPPCLYTTEKIKAKTPVNNTLNIRIPLRWTQDFGGGAAVDIKGTGELPPDGSSGDGDVGVEITPEVQ